MGTTLIPEHRTLFRPVPSPCCTPETNVTLYVDCTSIIKVKKKKEKEQPRKYLRTFYEDTILPWLLQNARSANVFPGQTPS